MIRNRPLSVGHGNSHQQLSDGLPNVDGYQKVLVFLSAINTVLAIVCGRTFWFAVVPPTFLALIVIENRIEAAIQRHLQRRLAAGERPWGISLFSEKDQKLLEAGFRRHAEGTLGQTIIKNALFTGVLLLQVALAFG